MCPSPLLYVVEIHQIVVIIIILLFYLFQSLDHIAETRSIVQLELISKGRALLSPSQVALVRTAVIELRIRHVHSFDLPHERCTVVSLCDDLALLLEPLSRLL